MKLKNYQEDVVLRAIEIALEDEPDLLGDHDFVSDVAAYVLNRIPPRYIMSERGFIRFALNESGEQDDGRSLANIIHLMMLVNRGVELVRTRRPPGGFRAPTDTRETGRFSSDGVFELVHNYPQVIGRVIHADTGTPVYNARVTLSMDGEAVPPAQRGWENPYTTRQQTRGYFSFWPRPVRSTREVIESRLEFTVEHADYAAYTHVQTISTTGALDATQILSGDEVLSLPPFALVRSGRGTTGSPAPSR